MLEFILRNKTYLNDVQRMPMVAPNAAVRTNKVGEKAVTTTKFCLSRSVDLSCHTVWTVLLRADIRPSFPP